jgi:hypothetical protein
MGLKEFWKGNKYNYLWSCLALFLMGSFIGLIKKNDMNATMLFILAGFPVMFIMGWGLHEFTGGDKD